MPVAPSAGIPISPRCSQGVPHGSVQPCLAAGVTQSSGTQAGEGSPRVQCGLARAVGWFPPELIQDPPERRTHVSTVPIKNKLCNRWIPISCSWGTAQSHPSLAVAQGRLSHSWKSSLTDASQQDRPMCLPGERFCHRPAPGSVQTEKGWQRSLVFFHYYHQRRKGWFWSPFPDLGPDC